MKNFKLLIITILTISTILLPCQSVFAADESLIDTKDQYSYIKGYQNNTFQPENNISRAEAMTIITRVMKEKPNADTNYTSSFPDVIKGEWYYNNIAFLEGYHILNGYEDNLMRPQNNINRAEFATIITKVTGFANAKSENASNFNDVPTNHWGYNAINICQQQGWLSGYPDGTFKPDNNITRAEAITLITRILGHKINTIALENYNGKTFSDVPSNYWAYGNIMQAATGGYYYTIPVLMYHYLAEDKLCEPGGIYHQESSVFSIDKFEAQMKYLRENGYKTLFVSELYQYISAGKMPPENSVVLTFDDGYKTDYVYAAPILEKYGLKANFSPIVYYSKVATETPESVITNYPHITFPQYKQMIDKGVAEIGSHSYAGHGQFPTENQGSYSKFFLSPRYIESEKRIETHDEYITRTLSDLTTSREILNKKLGISANFFVYPYGLYNNNAVNTVKKAGFNCAFQIGSESLSPLSDIYALPRYNINQGMALDSFISLLKK